MAANRLGPGHRRLDARRFPLTEQPLVIDRVRCVLRQEHHYLLVQHRAKRRINAGRWSLPGGRLKSFEEPQAGLRRELDEELGLRSLTPLMVGDWRDRHQINRIFGCRVFEPIDWYNRDEIRSIGWFALEEIMTLASASRLRRGFELAAVLRFERRMAS
jgi:8-oxo-dGTP pyrophosphatase MutT (NUDIX family)